jgi:hypothetical protein
MGWKEEAQQRHKEKSAGATIKMKDGLNCVRVAPNKKDLDANGRLLPKIAKEWPGGEAHLPYIDTYRMHYEVGPDKNSLGCGIVDGEGTCFICEQVEKLRASKDPNKRAMADRIQAKEVFILQAFPYDPDLGKLLPPKPWWPSTGSGIPGKQSNSLAVKVLSRIAGRKDLVHPEKGYNLNIEKTGEKMQTRYPDVSADESMSKVPEALLKMLKPLAELAPRYDIEDQKSAFYGRPKQDANSMVEETTEEETVTEETTEDEIVDTDLTEDEAIEDAEEETETEELETESESADEDTGEYEPEPEEEIEEIEPEPPPPPKKQAPKPATKQAPPPAKKPAPPAKKR